MMLRYAKFRVQFPIFSQDSAGIRDDRYTRQKVGERFGDPRSRCDQQPFVTKVKEERPVDRRRLRVIFN